jgi:hypothetical protein
MKVQVTHFKGEPSQYDPLAQRSFIALVWDADKELLEYRSDEDIEDVATRIADRLKRQIMDACTK